MLVELFYKYKETRSDKSYNELHEALLKKMRSIFSYYKLDQKYKDEYQVLCGLELMTLADNDAKVFTNDPQLSSYLEGCFISAMGELFKELNKNFRYKEVEDINKYIPVHKIMEKDFSKHEESLRKIKERLKTKDYSFFLECLDENYNLIGVTYLSKRFDISKQAVSKRLNRILRIIRVC
jgi:uncharacterized protein YgfB (UPF0149 family)